MLQSRRRTSLDNPPRWRSSTKYMPYTWHDGYACHMTLLWRAYYLLRVQMSQTWDKFVVSGHFFMEGTANKSALDFVVWTWTTLPPRLPGAQLSTTMEFASWQENAMLIRLASCSANTMYYIWNQRTTWWLADNHCCHAVLVHNALCTVGRGQSSSERYATTWRRLSKEWTTRNQEYGSLS